MIFAIEKLGDCWDEIMVLARAHWMETEMYRHGQEFAPSFERYRQYEDAGWLLQFTAREDGRLVGYATMYLVPSMHTQRLIATEDTWFLLPSHRKGRNAVRFYRHVEAECFRRGAVEVTMTAKMTNHAGRILEYLDFEKVAVQYSKQLARADSPLRQPEVESANVRCESPSGLR